MVSPLLDSITLRGLYQRWMAGETLRAIARSAGVPHCTLHAALRREYGPDACNVRRHSFFRSLVQDYPAVLPEWEAYLQLPPDDLTHRSQHSIQMLSRYQVVHRADQMEYLIDPATEDDNEYPVYLGGALCLMYLVYLGDLLRSVFRGYLRDLVAANG